MPSSIRLHSRPGSVCNLTLRPISSITAALLLVFVLSASTAHKVTPVTITVNNAGDVVANDNFCTLREAIAASNTNVTSGALANECPAGTSAVDTITFEGRYAQINLLSDLPPIIKPVVIDGIGSSRKQIRGALGASYVFKFDVGSAGSKLLGLTVSRAIVGVRLLGGGVTLGNNYIGTNASGTASDLMEIGVAIASSNNQIGFIDPDGTTHGNLISGNSIDGIYIQSGSKNTIQANLIGTDVTGGAVLANNYAGIELDTAAVGTIIGGTLPGQGNVISGNVDGISLFHGSTGTQIMRNKIGLSADGLFALPNAHGIADYGSIKTIIGGKMPVASNFISGNMISADTGNGIVFSGENNGNNIKITGNLFGVNVAGEPVPNFTGIAFLSQPTNVTISDNLIASQTNTGIYLDRGGVTASGNCITDNAYGVWYTGLPILKFQKNWWGNANGPTNSNSPGGTGDSVDGNIIFKPFLTARPSSCSGWGAILKTPKNNTVFVTGAPQRVTFKWSAVKTSSAYIYKLVGVASGTIANNVETSAAQTTPLTLNYDRYTLSLQTKSADGAHWAGPGSTFWVTIMKAPKPEAQLKAGPVKLMWAAYPGAVSYSVSVYTSDPVCGGMPASMPNFVGNSMTVYLAPGFYSWRVQPDNGPLMPCQPFTLEP